jgi:microcystin degradation protein MlrC
MSCVVGVAPVASASVLGDPVVEEALVFVPHAEMASAKRPAQSMSDELRSLDRKKGDVIVSMPSDWRGDMERLGAL